MKKFVLLPMLILSLTFGQLWASIDYNENFLSVDQKNALKAILENALNDQKLPSIVAAATIDDTVIWARGVGYSNIEDKISPRVEVDLYRWASVSKVATERFAQALEEEGRLKQSAPISTYIDIKEPSFYRRCFLDQAEYQKYLTCTKNYGGHAPIEMMQGFPLCFNPNRLDALELVSGNKTYEAFIADSTQSNGQIVYRQKGGEYKCRAQYKINLAYVSSNKVTLNNLLNHTSGVMHYSYLGLSSVPSDFDISNVDAIANRKSKEQSQMRWAISQFYPTKPLLFLPGKARSYSTFGYNLAGVVMEEATGKTFEKIMDSYKWPLGALSMQADYLGIEPTGPYRKVNNYKYSNGRFVNNNYNTDNSYKLAGGGIMSTIVDLGKFCAGISMPGEITRNGTGSYSHSGSHSDRTNSRLVLQTGGSGKKQCLVLMTNTEHSQVDLEKVRKQLAAKLYDLKVWAPPRS